MPKIYLSPPCMLGRERELLLDAFDSNWIAPLGPHVDAFEREFAARVGVDVRRALSARAGDARDVLPDGLRERGVEVEVLTTYEAVAEPLAEAVREAALGADYVTFASGTAARYFLDAVGGAAPSGRVVSIGPTTSGVLREGGVEPDVEASVHTPDGLVDALLADAAR